MSPSSGFDTYTKVAACAAPARVMSAVSMIPPASLVKVVMCALLGRQSLMRLGLRQRPSPGIIAGHARRDPGPDVAVASFAVELRDVGKRFGPVVALDG